MSLNNPAAICSTAAIKPYLRLGGFPAAQDYCSNLFSERPAQVGGPKCSNESDLCTLLSYLQDADLDFAQTVCCCIGECHTSKSTLISISTSLEPQTSSASSETGTTGSVSSIQSESSGATTGSQTATGIPTWSIFTTNSLSSSSPIASFPTSSSSTEPPTSRILSRPSVTSHTHTSSTTLTSRKTSVTPSTGSSFSTAILSSPSTISPSKAPPSTSPSSTTASSTTPYTACATCTYPTPTAECTAVNGYEQYYSGQCHVENVNNPGNVDPVYPPIYKTYPGTLNACDAASTCASHSEGFDSKVYTSFDLHYLCSNSSWVCVQYYGANFRGSYFDVQDLDAVVAYGYYSLGNHD